MSSTVFRWLSLGVGAALCTAALLQCGARTELMGYTNAGPIPSSDPCIRLAERACDRALACSVSAVTLGYGIGRSFVDRAQCVQRLTLGCTGWIAASDSNVTQAQAVACEARWASLSCAEVSRDFADEVLGCALSPGRREVSQPCASSVQCGTRSCSLSRDTECGRCAARGGGPPETTVGQPCRPNEYCSYPQRCVSGLCAWAPTEGERCEGRGGCVPYPLLVCVDGACVSNPVSAVGSGCGNTQGAATRRPPVCPSGSDCVNRNDFGSGRCAAFRTDGQSCTLFGDQPCQFPARCVRGRCGLATQDCR